MSPKWPLFASRYTYGPGMTFRGSLSYIDHDLPTGTEDIQGTALLLGTQIDF